MNDPRVSIRIDELVLHGVPREQRQAVAEAFEAELVRLFGESRKPFAANGAELPTLDLGTLDLPSGAAPDRIGRAVARQLHGGLT